VTDAEIGDLNDIVSVDGYQAVVPCYACGTTPTLDMQYAWSTEPVLVRCTCGHYFRLRVSWDNDAKRFLAERA
jgi:hypothetical protein